MATAVNNANPQQKRWIFLFVFFIIMWYFYLRSKKEKTGAVPSFFINRNAPINYFPPVVTGTFPTTTPTPTVSAPNQVTNLSGNVTGNTVNLSWQANTTGSTPTGYQVQRSQDGGATWTTIDTVTGNSFSQTGLSNATYLYRVLAVNGTAVGPASANATAVVSNTATPTAYALNSITCANVPNSLTRFAAVPDESNRGTGSIAYALKIKTLAGVVVRDFGNPINLSTPGQAIEFTPNDANIPANQRVTTPGTYLVELTANGITKTVQVTFTNASLGITATPPAAYALNSITCANVPNSLTSFAAVPDESNRGTGSIAYALKIKTLAGVVVRDFGNPINLSTPGQAIEFTPNDANIPANQRVTTPGTYLVELTANGITKTVQVTFTNASLGITATPPPVAVGGYLNNANWTPPAQTAPPTLKLISCRTSDFLNLTMDTTSNPELFKITPVPGGTYGASQLYLDGRLIPNAPFFVRLDQQLQLARRAMTNPNEGFGNWWNENFQKHELIEFVVTKRA